MTLTLLHGYSFTIRDDGTYDYRTSTLRGQDSTFLTGMRVIESEGTATNRYGLSEISLEDDSNPGGYTNWESLQFPEDLFAFTITTASGATLSALQYLREDRSSGAFFLISGNPVEFGSGQSGFDALIAAMETIPPVPLATETVFTIDDLSARVYASQNYTDLPGHATILWLPGQDDNILRMGDGADYVISGDGDDWIAASGAFANDPSAEAFTLFETQYLNGGAGNDTLKFIGDGTGIIDGGNGDDRIFGGAGNDTLYGGFSGALDSADTDSNLIFGFDGHDRIFGGDGRDRIYGGEGDDYIQDSSGYSVLRGGSGDDLIWSGNSRDYEPGFSRVFGGAGNDSISVLDSPAGNAITSYVNGGAGDDEIRVSYDSHTVLRGGSGADTFAFTSLSQGAQTRIRDFEPGLDKLEPGGLVGADYDALIANAEQKPYGVRLVHDETNIYLFDVLVSELSESDFIF